jgi:outer membrane protein OmpA-like peptidoglycan-associated protein
MKKTLITMAVVLVAQASPALSATELIKEHDYIYNYDEEAKSMNDDVFVVCGDCKDSQLNPIYNVTVRYSSRTEDQIDADNVKPQMEDRSKTPSLSSVINFSFDSYRLSKASKNQLDSVDLKGKKVVIDGFTCTIGRSKYNLTLSKKRARTVADYLISKGVSVLKISGLGESSKYKNKPLNRRVEIWHNEPK